jgi:hypothetical protein
VAKRGAKPKPAHLRLVDGTRNVTRHGSEEKLREQVDASVASFGKLERPKGFKGPALDCWKRLIEPATWLDRSRYASAVALCELWQEFKFAPTAFPASKHGQMRAYMSELGLTDERNRVIDESKKDKDEFFDD